MRADTRDYFVYITTNPNRTVLYIGVTNNLTQRLWQHQQDVLDHRKTFVSKYNCYHLVYWEHFQNVQHAIAREKELKGWRRDKKEQLIEKSNPKWRVLNSELGIPDVPTSFSSS